MSQVCAFSGHRILQGLDFDHALLDRVILNLIRTGTEKFLCGMALGFDLAAAESVLFYKREYDVKLTACLPCANQSEGFSLKNKQRYERILNACDERVILSPYYYKGCMHARDRYMVENSDVLLCFLRKNSGGTYYTRQYAKQLGKKMIEI